MEYQSPFHTEILSHMLRDVEHHMQETGLTSEKEWVYYKDLLQSAIRAESKTPFASLLSQYHQLFFQKATLLEKNFLGLCSLNKQKVLRSLPRLYHRDNPMMSRIKPEFTDFAALKTLALDAQTLKDYQNIAIPKGTKITLFTYMVSDGWGDFAASQEALKILKTRFPDAHLQSIVCIPQHMAGKLLQPVDRTLSIVAYDGDCRPTALPESALQILRTSAVIVSLPTYYPYMDKLQKFLVQAGKTPPTLLSIGEYGFLESQWFHPKSGNYSMGLHFLEKGIFIRDTLPKGNLLKLENRALAKTLFGTETPKEHHLADYNKTHQLYLAYLLTPIGGAIYLHALLSFQKTRTESIDICTPELSWLIEFVDLQTKQGRPLLEGNFGVQRLEIHFQGQIHTKTFALEGKIVRILCTGTLSNTDFRNLLDCSRDFIAVRGNQSFSEAVSSGKLFFYDGAPHSRYFVKDFLALVENRLSQNKPALQFFRGIGQSFLHNLPEEKTEWVDETFFQEKKPWQQIAESIAGSLQMPQTAYGCKQLCQVIRNEYSFNKTLSLMVQRAIASRT